MNYRNAPGNKEHEDKFIRSGWGRSLIFAALGTLLVILLGTQTLWPIAQGKAGQNATQQPDVSPDLQLAESLSEKAAMAERFESSLSSGKLSPAPRIAIQTAPDLPGVENPPFRTGIINGEPGPFYAEVLFVQNLWQIIEEDGFIQVFAGALGNDLSQGVVVVLTTGMDRIQGSEDWVLTPEKTGAVRIVETEAGFLTLHSSQGKRYIFDLNKMTFIND
jgi:hypothetical protein